MVEKEKSSLRKRQSNHARWLRLEENEPGELSKPLTTALCKLTRGGKWLSDGGMRGRVGSILLRTSQGEGGHEFRLASRGAVLLSSPSLSLLLGSVSICVESVAPYRCKQV